jgi:hypothetical protein
MYEVSQFEKYTIPLKVGYKDEILSMLKEALSKVTRLKLGSCRSMIAGEFRIKVLAFLNCTDGATSYW